MSTRVVRCPPVGPFSPDDPWAPSGAEPAAVDPEEAQSLLDQAGVDPASLDFELIAYNDRPEFGDLAAVIQDQLGQIGITVKIKAGEYAPFEPDMLSGDFDAALLSRGYLVDLGDPVGYLSPTAPVTAATTSRTTATPRSTPWSRRRRRMEDSEARNAIYAQVAEKLQGDPASVFLSTSPW